MGATRATLQSSSSHCNCQSASGIWHKLLPETRCLRHYTKHGLEPSASVSCDATWRPRTVRDSKRNKQLLCILSASRFSIRFSISYHNARSAKDHNPLHSQPPGSPSSRTEAAVAGHQKNGWAMVGPGPTNGPRHPDKLWTSLKKNSQISGPATELHQSSSGVWLAFQLHVDGNMNNRE